MKKLLSFLRSMRFGLILLLPVLVCSVLGSIIPQGESESLYAQNFPGTYHIILGLGLNHIFSGWVFLSLTALFCINLALCSVSQLRAVPARRAAAAARAADASIEPVTGYNADSFAAYMKKHGWRQQAAGDRSVYVSAAPGWYGSVITHFAILGVILGALGIFGFTGYSDYEILPGENYLPDGLTLVLDDFRVTDAEGRIDYVSTLEVIDATGRSSGLREISVNHPLRFGENKYYQQSYGIAGSMTVTVKATGEVTPLYLTEPSFISAGGTDSIMYHNVYPGFVETPDGERQVLTQSAGGEYPDPAYYVVRLADGITEPMILLPGESVEPSDAAYRFDEPIYYPAIRVKTTPILVYALLYVSFVLLTLGLSMCFFVPTGAVAADGRGYTIVSKKWETELRERFRTTA